MKTFEDLFIELENRVALKLPDSGTVEAIKKGKHYIGKKIVEEAAEVWMAAEHEGRERTAREISQLLYHIQVMMLKCGLKPEDVYHYL